MTIILAIKLIPLALRSLESAATDEKRRMGNQENQDSRQFENPCCSSFKFHPPPSNFQCPISNIQILGTGLSGGFEPPTYESQSLAFHPPPSTFQMVWGDLRLEFQQAGVSKTPPSNFQHPISKTWWPGADLNHRRRDFQSLALPLSYPAEINYQFAMYNCQ